MRRASEKRTPFPYVVGSKRFGPIEGRFVRRNVAKGISRGVRPCRYCGGGCCLLLSGRKRSAVAQTDELVAAPAVYLYRFGVQYFFAFEYAKAEIEVGRVGHPVRYGAVGRDDV